MKIKSRKCRPSRLLLDQADQTPQVEKDEEIPQPDAQLEQEIPHPEETAEENVPARDNEFIVLNPESAMVVSPPIPQHNLNPVQRLPFSKRPKFQKENFFEEHMYFIGENPYDKPQMRHLMFWTRTQMNYYASVLCGRNKIFQRHIPHLDLEEIPAWNQSSVYYMMRFALYVLTYQIGIMTQNTHYKAPAYELLENCRTNSFRRGSEALCVLAPIKGHDDDEDVVGLMKNILFNIIHGIPMNIHDFFLRTLADNAMCPYDHKIYAPWIMRFLRTRTGINFHADFQNHVGYMPPIRVNKNTFEPIEGKGKSVIDEGSRPLDGQFKEPDAYSSWDDTETRPPSPVPPRANHERTSSRLHRRWITTTNGSNALWCHCENPHETRAVKLNHHYLHEVLIALATLAHLKTQTELEELNFEQDFDWSWPPKKKFRPIPVPDLEDSSFSSFRTAESDEEQLDTATGPRKNTTPKKRQGSSSTAKQ
ncbi:hypothetical protein ZWY2020_033864 [Hordeum vulgare]|nr:hypothetical protein ZWY2020_033864 [Hordeum vulgare]